MTTRTWSRLIVAGGAVVGLGLWAYDHDMFLNAGGPEAPWSEAMLRALGLDGAPFPLRELVPALAFAAICAATAGLCSWLVRRRAARR